MKPATHPMPRINLNGTDKAQLRKEYMDAIAAIQQAWSVVSQITVHDRDYHMIDPQAGHRARMRKRDWLTELVEIETDLTDVVMHIDEHGAE